MKRTRVHKITKKFEIIPEKKYHRFKDYWELTGHYLVIQEGVAHAITQENMDLMREANGK